MSDRLLANRFRYSAAFLSTAAALGATSFLPPLEAQASSSLFFAAVMISSWIGGLGPGLLATFLSAWAIDFFVVAPAYAYVIGWDDAVRTGVFVLVAILISWLNTRRNRLEGELRQHALRLAEMDRRKDEFLAVLAHELLNGLTPFLNAIHVLRLNNSSELSLKLLDPAERQARHMARLIEDVLDLARAGQGKLRLVKEQVELGAAVGQATECLRPQCDERGHQLEVSIPDEPLYVRADRTRLDQIVVNLLTNAVKYTEPGGKIQCSVTRNRRQATLRVRDNGIGIARELIPYVFDPFMQCDSGHKHSRGGLGIGLSLVRELVELHDGHVVAQSGGLGDGSEFIVHLPLIVFDSRESVDSGEESAVFFA